MTAVDPDVLVVPAFSTADYDVGAFDASDPPDELAPWTDRYDLPRRVDVPGLAGPLLCSDRLAVATTGIGKAAAASSVATLCADPAVDLSEAYVLSAGMAGVAPDRGTLGSVFLADAVVDWDLKYRRDAGRAGDPGADRDRDSDHDRGSDRDRDNDRGSEDGGDDREGRGTRGDRPSGDPDGWPPVEELDFLVGDPVFELSGSLVDRALVAARSVELADDPSARAACRRYPRAAARAPPTVGVGPTLCGDEFWHGRELARQARWLCDRYGLPPHATTEMEDAATATALDRFGRLDRYLSVRAACNFDRPAPGTSADPTDGAAFDLARANLVRVAGAVVDDLLGG